MKSWRAFLDLAKSWRPGRTPYLIIYSANLYYATELL
jgi:hypothetical protein